MIGKGMALNHNYWRRVFAREFPKQLRSLVDALEQRIVPAFDGIEREAETATEQAWEAFMSSPASGDDDPSEFADAANDIGVDHYLTLSGVRQGILNMFAAGLYHLFEQQMMIFLRRELLRPSEENDVKLFSLREAQVRLNSHGVDVRSLSAWVTVEDLRLVANSIKHAEGDWLRNYKGLDRTCSSCRVSPC